MLKHALPQIQGSIQKISLHKVKHNFDRHQVVLQIPIKKYVVNKVIHWEACTCHLFGDCNCILHASSLTASFEEGTIGYYIHIQTLILYAIEILE
jgi:hypothetical protein